MKKLLPSTAIVAALFLSGCSGGGSGKQDSGAQDSGAQATPTPEITQLSVDQLKTVVSNTKAGDLGFKTLDSEEDPAGMAKVMDSIAKADISPAECKATFVEFLSVFGATGTNANSVRAEPTDKEQQIGTVLNSYPDENSAKTSVGKFAQAGEQCSDMKVQVPTSGEATASFKNFNASVEGATESVGTELRLQGEESAYLFVTSRDANNIVTTVADDTDAEAFKSTAPSVAAAFITGMKNAR